jgi:uncharacterized membrane protein YdjX (TVP38/TMEM64 family)
MFSRIIRLFRRPRALFTTKEVLVFGIVVALFTLSVALARIYEDEIRRIILESGEWGIVFFILTSVFDALVAIIPIVVTFIPMAVLAWGPLATALFTTVGWWVGALIAFYLSRKYGRGFVAKMVSLNHVEKIASRIPTKHQFLILALLFSILPSDILSFAVGVFTSVRLATYLPASFLGILATSLVFGYGVTLPALHQLIAGTMLFIIITTIFAKVMR